MLLMLVPIPYSAVKGGKDGIITAAAAMIIGISTGLFSVYISRKDLSVGKQVLYILLFMLGVGVAAVLAIVFIGSLIGIIGGE